MPLRREPRTVQLCMMARCSKRPVFFGNFAGGLCERHGADCAQEWGADHFHPEYRDALRALLRDRDGAEGGDAKAAPVNQDRQARAEGIAQSGQNPQKTAISSETTHDR